MKNEFKEEDLEKIKLVRKLLNRNNFIDKVDLNIHNITKEHIDLFCKYYGLQFFVRERGAWVFMQFENEKGEIANGLELKNVE